MYTFSDLFTLCARRHASQQQQPESSSSHTWKPRGPAPSEASRPTAISLLKGSGVATASVDQALPALAEGSKSGQLGPCADTRLLMLARPLIRHPSPVNRKIAALEAKLAAMRQSNPNSNPSSRDSTPGAAPSEPSGSGGVGATAKIDPYKAGLPARPYFESRDPPREM